MTPAPAARRRGQAAAPRCSQAKFAASQTLDEHWQPLFGDWRDAVAFLACQDAAIAPVPRNGKLVFGKFTCQLSWIKCKR